MRVNRLELIGKISRFVADMETHQIARKSQAYTKAAQAETDYVLEQAENWRKFADTIRLRLRRGQAITIEDVPGDLRQATGWGRSVKLFEPVTVKQSDYVPATNRLVRLVAVLETSSDEEISTTSLDRMGVNLRELFR